MGDLFLADIASPLAVIRAWRWQGAGICCIAVGMFLFLIHMVGLHIRLRGFRACGLWYARCECRNTNALHY